MSTTHSTATPIHVFDVHAKTAQGRLMHFDVILPENNHARALATARDWLTSIGHAEATVTAGNCCFCHSEATAPAPILAAIEEQGYAIFKMEGCPA